MIDTVKTRRRTTPGVWRRVVAGYRKRRRTPAIHQTARPFLWRGTRPDGASVLLCSHHLMRDCVGDVRPAGEVEGACAVCTALTGVTNHAAARWRERIAPEISADEARAEIGRFAAGGCVAETPPRWLRAEIVEPHELVVNGGFPGVGLVVKSTRRARTVVTVLTAWTAEAA